MRNIIIHSHVEVVVVIITGGRVIQLLSLNHEIMSVTCNYDWLIL